MDFEKLKFTDKDFTVVEQPDGTNIIAFRHRNKLFVGEVIPANQSPEPGGGPGSSAPLGSAYVTIGNDGSLTAERALIGGSGVNLIDGGANSNVTFDLGLLINNWIAGNFLISSFGMLTDYVLDVADNFIIPDGKQMVIADSFEVNGILTVNGRLGVV